MATETGLKKTLPLSQKNKKPHVWPGFYIEYSFWTIVFSK